MKIPILLKLPAKKLSPTQVTATIEGIYCVEDIDSIREIDAGSCTVFFKEEAGAYVVVAHSIREVRLLINAALSEWRE